MIEKLNESSVKMLSEALLSLKTPQECANLLEDLCTMSEIKAMAQRIEVARMLSENVVYSDIVRTTGASTATISRVNRALNYGAGGYATVLERMDEKEKNNG